MALDKERITNHDRGHNGMQEGLGPRRKEEGKVPERETGGLEMGGSRRGMEVIVIACHCWAMVANRVALHARGQRGC
jgi:hypothetical protein